MRSLRFRLPAIFLLGVVLAGLVTAVIAVSLFRNHSEEQTIAELRRQAKGLADLYADQTVESFDENKPAPSLAAASLEQATGARLYYVGTRLFFGQDDSPIAGLRRLLLTDLGLEALPPRTLTVEFEPPGQDKTYVAIAEPITPGGEVFGALVVAKPKDELSDPILTLAWRVALACLGGLVVAAGLFLYLSRRVTGPLLALSKAADVVAAGRYDVELPAVRSRDEIGHLADRFGEMTERLQEASELERNFLMTISHELRTPLTAIRGHADALREGLADDAEARDASLAVITTETERLARLVGDLLDLAKLEANRFSLREEEVDLERLLEQAYQTFSEEARGREIDFEREIDEAPTIVSDGDRLLQIVSNLLLNAFEWTPDGGRVELAATSSGGRVAISIADSGPGIPREEQERIFRPFWSRNGQGTGLGLAIARELAHALGGWVELESRVGAGSRFVVVLPARRVARATEPTAVA